MSIEEFGRLLDLAIPGKVFELAAPKGMTEYAVWHEYAPRTLGGDNAVQLEVSRVQIDVIWQKDKSLLKSIKQALSDNGLFYEIVEHGYDDEWQAMRCILQLEVL